MDICVTSTESIVGIVGTVVMAVSAVANFIPEPDKIDNTVLRGISRAIHFIAFDIKTGAQKK